MYMVNCMKYVQNILNNSIIIIYIPRYTLPIIPIHIILENEIISAV